MLELEPEALESEPAAGDGYEPVPGDDRLCRQLEALLFIAAEALPIERLAALTAAPVEAVATALAELEERYAGRGINVRAIAGGYRFATSTGVRDAVEAYLLPPKTTLSPAALETLAIIAYSQPLTKSDIEAVRGVSVDGIVAGLVERGFVVETGRKDTAGRPALFATTTQFLEAFGLVSLADLPPLPDEQAGRLASDLASPALLEGTIGEEDTMSATTLENVIDPIDPRPIDPVEPTGPIEPTEPIEPLTPPLQDRNAVKPEAYADAVEAIDEADAYAGARGE